MNHDDKKETGTEPEGTGWWMGAAMCGGVAVLMLIGWLFRGSVTP
jgi:hypothetical protein